MALSSRARNLAEGGLLSHPAQDHPDAMNNGTMIAWKRIPELGIAQAGM
jgi:hypothetical protein